MRPVIEDKFLRYAWERNLCPDRRREFIGGGVFSSYANNTKSSLFASVDFAYCYYILGLTEELSTTDSIVRWIDHILSYQSEDGWFRSRDTQQHSVEHASAYALGGIQLLSTFLPSSDSTEALKGLKPFHKLKEQLSTHRSANFQPPDTSMLNKLHFWRGSHRIAGVPAIIGACSTLPLPCENIIGLSKPSEWLQDWADYYLDLIDPTTGYWKLAPAPLQITFDAVYRFRHNPLLAKMGGAAHLYWIFRHLGILPNYPRELAYTTISIQKSTGLFEERPYCIDLDATFLLSECLKSSDLKDFEKDDILRSAASNRSAVILWLAENEWAANTHKIPGALASIAEVDNLLPEYTSTYNSPMHTSWWL